MPLSKTPLMVRSLHFKHLGYWPPKMRRCVASSCSTDPRIRSPLRPSPRLFFDRSPPFLYPLCYGTETPPPPPRESPALSTSEFPPPPRESPAPSASADFSHIYSNTSRANMSTEELYEELCQGEFVQHLNFTRLSAGGRALTDLCAAPTSQPRCRCSSEPCTITRQLKQMI